MLALCTLGLSGPDSLQEGSDPRLRLCWRTLSVLRFPYSRFRVCCGWARPVWAAVVSALLQDLPLTRRLPVARNCLALQFCELYFLRLPATRRLAGGPSSLVGISLGFHFAHARWRGEGAAVPFRPVIVSGILVTNLTPICLIRVGSSLAHAFISVNARVWKSVVEVKPLSGGSLRTPCVGSSWCPSPSRLGEVSFAPP